VSWKRLAPRDDSTGFGGSRCDDRVACVASFPHSFSSEEDEGWTPMCTTGAKLKPLVSSKMRLSCGSRQLR
jgi:hypothetical protein